MTLNVVVATVALAIGASEWAQSAFDQVWLKPDTTIRGSRSVRLQADPASQDSATSMEGCIAKRTNTQQALTFQDAASGFRYRITGRNLGRYAGQKVEIVGATPRPRRLAVRGGLWPSPNVAGQAGAMDPARAAIAAQPGGPESGTGGVELLPEFRVTRVRAVQGACE